MLEWLLSFMLCLIGFYVSCSLEAINRDRKLFLVSLYFLIWGEAANVRFLPECICYIFHHVSSLLCFFNFGTLLPLLALLLQINIRKSVSILDLFLCMCFHATRIGTFSLLLCFALLPGEGLWITLFCFRNFN